jgi:hypothetical protein
MKTLIGFLVIVLGFTLSAQPRPDVKVPEEMKQLDFLIGTWEVHSNTINKKGEIVYESDYEMIFEKDLKGMLILAKSGHYDVNNKFDQGQWTWYFYDTQVEKFMDVNFDIVGNFEIKVGTFVNDKLILAYPVPKKAQDGVYRIWQKTMQDIQSDSFTWIWHYSEDEGKTWIKHWHTTFKRKK